MAKKAANKGEAVKYIIVLVFLAVLILATIGIWRVRYAPSTERMSLASYYGVSGKEAALFVNGEKSDTKKAALVSEGHYYILLSELKSSLDDGYVYDDSENILRYATDRQVISVNKGDTYYTVGRSQEDLGQKILITGDGDKPYVAVDFADRFTDFTYRTGRRPYRLVIEKAGYSHKVTTISKDTEIRRFGGPKSRILADAKKGTKVNVLESYGKWSQILTNNGILGCVKDNTLGDISTEKNKKRLEARKYNHIRADGKVNLLWHQVTNTTANSGLDQVLSDAEGITVISPTWFRIADNDGGLSDIGSLDYVKKCHDKGVQVWALFSNFENKNVDTTSVLNTTSSRDNLVNNMIAKAIAYNLDGINVDFEQVSTDAKDGYVEFIKELSIKCENNDLILSVDNYPPTASSLHYNRKIQAQYADYLIVMAYDEHYAGSGEAGSNASISFVKKAVSDSLKEVPKSQLILGMPFYSRIWTTKDGTLSTETIAMKNISSYIKSHNAQESWQDDLGQNYVEFSEDGATKQLWVEDEKSLALKLGVMKDNDLAGGAFWKEGLESDSIWEIIGKYMQ
ncbi:MAG: glycosyl hydrolase family 18 protein [Lachnospiraceae bacterium]|nr:glycosyl hydrolase family 18 protein [Lachnospiraceae bacterium]